MKNFRDTIEEIKEGTKSKSFNKNEFNKLTISYFNNEGGVEVDEFDSHGEKIGSHNAPKSFREGLLTNVCKHAGLSGDEATEKAMSYEFKKKDVEPIHDIISDTVLEFIGLGRKFTFNRTEDNETSMSMEVKEAQVTEHKTKSGTYEVTNEEYRKAKVHSSCPDWKKTSVKKD